MEIQTSQKFCIITPLSPTLDARQAERLKQEFLVHSNQKIGMDLSYVQDCTIEFLNLIKEIGAGIFNMQADIFAMITLMHFDKNINVYMTQDDFLNNKNRILNRKFRIV